MFATEPGQICAIVRHISVFFCQRRIRVLYSDCFTGTRVNPNLHSGKMAHLRSIVALAGASLASAAMPAQTNWLQQGGNDWRTSAITYNADLPGSKGKSSISHVSMGHRE